MTDSSVEAVARAIFAESKAVSIELGANDISEASFDQMSADEQEFALRIARAAIAALPSPEREPMREALEKCLAIACDYTLDERTARSDIANIARAALAPPPAQSGDRT